MLIIPTPTRRRRRREAPPAPTARPLVAPFFGANGTQAVLLWFDRPTFVVDGIAPGAFVTGGGFANNLNQLDDYTIQVLFQSSAPPGDDVWQVFAGDAFVVSDQSWLDRPDALPAAGVFAGYPLPDVSIDIVSRWDATSVNVPFTDFVSIDRAAVPDAALTVNGHPVAGIPLLAGGGVLVNVAGALTATSWSLSGQPAWLRNRVVFPASGTVQP
jgi:hypothetical protein